MGRIGEMSLITQFRQLVKKANDQALSDGRALVLEGMVMRSGVGGAIIIMFRCSLVNSITEKDVTAFHIARVFLDTLLLCDV
jgi:hypothetical protein